MCFVFCGTTIAFLLYRQRCVIRKHNGGTMLSVFEVNEAWYWSKPGLVDDALSVFGFLFGFLFHKWYQNNVASKYLIEYEVKLRKCAV